jgi:hypothetical protein
MLAGPFPESKVFEKPHHLLALWLPKGAEQNYNNTRSVAWMIIPGQSNLRKKVSGEGAPKPPAKGKKK